MTLHDAISLVLKENSNGLTLHEIADQINKRKLYEKKDKSKVEPSQLAIRINNYSHLFFVDKGKLYAHTDFENHKHLFDHIIHDIIASTSDDAISAKQTVIPFLVFLKRVIEASDVEYKIIVPLPFREWYEEFEDDISTSSLKEYQTNLLEAIDDLSAENFRLDNLRSEIVELVKNHSAEMLMKIHLTLNKYSFDSKTFNQEEFGHFFNTLIERLSKSAAHSGRSSTPDDINKIITSLYNEQSHVLMDPFAGKAGTLIKRQQRYASANVIGYEVSKESWLTGALNLIINGIDPLFFYNSNSLKVTGIFKKKADLIITDIPFGGTFKNDEFDFLHWSKTKDATSIYLQYILDSLESDGKAVVTIPNGFLFNTTPSVRQLKKVLVENNWLDAVISLPQGIFLPFTSIASAILCINLNKSNKENCLFIDASDMKLTKKNIKEQEIEDENIDTILEVFRKRPKIYEDSAQIFAGTFSTEEIIDQEFDLTPKRYVYAETKEAQIELFGDEFTQLGEILNKATQPFDFSPTVTANQIYAKDLKSSVTDYIIKNGDIPKTNETKGSTLSLLSQDALLILTHFTNLKPTYFIFEGQPVLLPNSIKAFEFNIDKVLPEYLITQLHELYFTRQLESIRKGSAQQYFSIKDFFKLKIRLPKNLHEQRAIYEKAKEKQLEKKAGEAEILTEKLQKQKAEAVSDQIAIISSIQHELGNKLPALKNTIDDLKAYAIQAEKNAAVFSIDAKIRPVLSGEDEKEVDSIKNIFDRIDSILNYTISMVDDAGGIITSDPSKFKPQKARLFEYLKSEIDNFRQVHGQKENIQFELPVEEGPMMNIDKKQFAKALNNLVLNAIRHGFTDSRKQYHMVFQLVPDDKYDILIIKNDGNAFPDDFTIEKYKQPYQYAGKNGHSGLGGYIINQVIENHGGVMDLIKDIDPADSFKVQFEFKFPKVYFL